MRPLDERVRAGLWWCASLAVLALLPVAVFYPGLINADTIGIYANARDGGPASNWHSPLLVYLWRGLLRLGFDMAAFTALDGVVYWCGALWLLHRAGLRPWQQCLAGVAICLMPPMLTWLGTPEKTTVTACVLSVLLALTQMVDDAPASRRRLLGLSVVALLGVWTRPNAVLFVAPVLAWAAWRHHGPMLLRLGVLPLVLALGLGAPMAGVRLGLVLSQAPEQELFALDLMNLSMEVGHSLVPDGQLTVPLDTAAAAMRAQPSPPFGGRYSMVALRANGMMLQHWDAASQRALRDAWVRALLEYPATYLRYRLDLFWQFACFDRALICYDSWHWYTGGVDTPNPMGLRSQVWQPGFAFYRGLAGTVFYRPWFLTLAALAILAVAVARRRAVVMVFAAVLLLNVASYLFLMPGISARMMVPVGLLLPPLIVALFVRPRRVILPPPGPAPSGTAA